MPFQQLIQKNPELAQLRQDYISVPAEKRQMAAGYEYDSEAAAELFNKALSKIPNPGGFAYRTGQGPCPGAVRALAIDPTFAPALLTVGSVEYQLGQADEAIRLFLELTTLPDDTEELADIIDKAGDFLFDEKDYIFAKALYEAATRHYPSVAIYHSGLGYCFAKLHEHDKAILSNRKAVDLEPTNYRLLSDLGWSLIEAESYPEAETVLVKAVEQSPQGYEMAKNNLKELRRRMRNKEKQL